MANIPEGQDDGTTHTYNVFVKAYWVASHVVTIARTDVGHGPLKINSNDEPWPHTRRTR